MIRLGAVILGLEVKMARRKREAELALNIVDSIAERCDPYQT